MTPNWDTQWKSLLYESQLTLEMARYSVKESSRCAAAYRKSLDKKPQY